jgi:hypothetical protein
VLFRLEDETLAVASPAGITCTNVASSVPSAGAGATCASADLRLSEPIPRLSNRGSWAARKREQGTNMTMWTWSCPSFAVCQIRNQPERLYLRHRDSSEMVVLWCCGLGEYSLLEKTNYDVRCLRPRHLRIHPCVRLEVTEFLCARSRMRRFEVGLLLSTSRGSLKHSVAQKQFKFLDRSNFQVYSHGQPRTVAREYPATSGGSNSVHEDYLLCVHQGVKSFSGFVSHLPVKIVLGRARK